MSKSIVPKKIVVTKTGVTESGYRWVEGTKDGVPFAITETCNNEYAVSKQDVDKGTARLVKDDKKHG